MLGGDLFLVGGWKQVTTQLVEMFSASGDACDAAIRDEAVLFLRTVQLAFRRGGVDGQWPELNAITTALRKGTKPLMDSGSLWRSVKLEKQGPGEYFVGVHRTAGKSKSGEPLVNVAEAHETGAKIIPITDKMRRYFRALYWKKIIPFPWPAASARYIKIPRRSFLADTMQKSARNHEARLMVRYAEYLTGGGRIGWTEKDL